MSLPLHCATLIRIGKQINRRVFVFELRKQSAWLWAALLAAHASLAAAQAAARVSVIDLLRALSATGSNILYSSELVPATLDAPDALPNDLPLARAAAALAANGLKLQRTGERTYVVTRVSASPQPFKPPSASQGTAAPGPGPRSSLGEVSVFASRYEFTSEKAGEPAEFNDRRIEEMPGARSDFVRALRTAPGLATNLSARPYLRGALLDDVRVEYDGIALAEPFHFRDFQSVISVFNPATVNRADVYTGGFPVRYGTRSGGVIDLVPASVPSGSEYAVGASFLSYDFETVGHADTLPIEWLLVARKSSDDSVLKRLLSEGGEPSFYDGVGRVRWTIDPASALTLGWLMLSDKVTFDSPDEHATGRSRDVTTWLRWDWTPGASLQGHSSVAFADTERDNRGSLSLPGIANGTLRAERSFSTVALRSDWTYLPKSALSWNFGGEFTRETADLTIMRQETLDGAIAAGFGRNVDASVASGRMPHSYSLGLYSAAHRRWRAFEAEAGLRFDSQDYQGYGVRSQLAPRVNLRYDFSAGWHAYGSWGQFAQAQRVDEYRSEANQATPDPANRAQHLVAGVAHESEDSTTWRVEAYRHHWSTISPYFDNSLGPISLLPQLEPDRVLVVPADADAAGLEFSAQRSLTRNVSVWGGYTLSTVTDDTQGREVPRSWDQPHAANVGIAWMKDGTSASALLGWHSGWPKTPVNLVAAGAAQAAYIRVGGRNSARWGSYASADLRLSTTLQLSVGELSLWLDGTNLTNRSNLCCADLNSMGPSDGEPGLDTGTWSPRVVNVGFTFRVRRTD